MPTHPTLTTSSAYEYYTPQFIINAARKVMGSIDLDPASSKRANRTVNASEFYTLAEDGLHQQWFGNVFLNHPFGRILNRLWIDKVQEEFYSGRVEQACVLTYACTSEKWFQPLLKHPQCFLFPRTNYLLPDGIVKRGVQKGSVVTYLGHRQGAFVRNFGPLGTVKVAAS